MSLIFFSRQVKNLLADLNDDGKSGNNSGPILKMSAKERGKFLHL
jgi:hypothetical protein